MKRVNKPRVELHRLWIIANQPLLVMFAYLALKLGHLSLKWKKKKQFIISGSNKAFWVLQGCGSSKSVFEPQQTEQMKSNANFSTGSLYFVF